MSKNSNIKKYIEKTYNKSASEFYDLIKSKLKNDEKVFVVTANPETLMIAEENEEFNNALLDENTIIIPDGIGVVKGAKMLNIKMEETIPGVELSVKLFEYANKYEKTVCLFGAKPEVIEKMKTLLGERYPKLKLLGAYDGYVTDKNKIMQEIKVLQPDIVLVALGIPNQELLIYNNLRDFKKGIFVGVGGSFDVISECKRRAPKLFRKFHLEWLYRILREPKRIRRFMNSNCKYIFTIRKLRRKQND